MLWSIGVVVGGLRRESLRVATLRRTPTGDRPVGRRLLPCVATVVLAAVLVPLGPSAALADPAPPPATAADAQAQLTQVQHEAEALTEQWHAASDDVKAKQAQVTTFRDAVEPAKQAVEKARADEEAFRKQVDVLSLSTFESANLDQFNALLASGSPQRFLDQMSALETLAADQKAVLGKLLADVEATKKAQQDADAAVARAQSSADEAAKAEQDLAVRKKDAEMRIDAAEKLLERLTPAQRREHNGPDVSAPAPSSAGSGVGVAALRAAATQLGKPYSWGATGPGSYDCSGLTSFAFRKAGVTLPRSSSAQAGVGKPVSFDELQPGDLVFYYQPVSHVGIYAGDGKMINAPQSGDVVRYQKVSTSAFSGARRL